MNVSGIRLIFLDVDGVLCCNKHGHLEADKLKRLAGIVQRTNSKVVLSTDWRRHPELKQRLMQVLATHDCQVIGATLKGPALEPVRPREITAWLDGYETERHLHASPAVSSWVAVDDRPLLREDGGEALTGHFVQTIFQFGLDDIAAERMTAILLEDEKSMAKNTPPSTLTACTNTNVTPMAALWLSGGAAAPAPSPHAPLGVQVQWIHVSPPAAHVTADEERRERIGRHLRSPTSPSKPVEPAQHVPPSPVPTVTPTLSCVSPSPYGPSPTAPRSTPSSPPSPSFQGGRWVQGKSSTDCGSASGAAAPKSLTCNDIGQLSGYSPASGSAAPSVTSPGCGQSCCHAAPMYQHVPPKQAERSRQTRSALSRSSPPSITALRQVATMQSTMPPFASMMPHGLAFSHQGFATSQQAHPHGAPTSPTTALAGAPAKLPTAAPDGAQRGARWVPTTALAGAPTELPTAAPDGAQRGARPPDLSVQVAKFVLSSDDVTSAGTARVPAWRAKTAPRTAPMSSPSKGASQSLLSHMARAREAARFQAARAVEEGDGIRPPRGAHGGALDGGGRSPSVRPSIQAPAWSATSIQVPPTAGVLNQVLASMSPSFSDELFPTRAPARHPGHKPGHATRVPPACSPNQAAVADQMAWSTAPPGGLRRLENGPRPYSSESARLVALANAQQHTRRHVY